MSSTPTNLIQIEPGQHKLTGPSSAERWLGCAGSINLTKKLIKAGLINPSSSRPAAEGTAAHLVLSTCLEDGSDAEEMRDFQLEVEDWIFIVDDEMVDGVQETLNWVRARIARAKSEGFEVELYIERWMTSILDEDAGGTGDILIHIIGDRLIVVDFKYGRGVSVEPTSDQNGCYGYLGVENFVIEVDGDMPVESWIAQPRIPHPDGTIRCHETTAQELIDWWLETVIPGIEATRDPNAPLVIGEHCRFCPNKGHCPALKNETFELPVGIDPLHLSDEELGEILVKLAAIKLLIPVMEAEALRRVRKGDKIPGKKLVRKRANRAFKTFLALPHPTNADETVEVKLEDAVRKAFGPDGFSTPDILSPKQMEGLDGGKQFVADWSYSPNNGLTLAGIKDKRKEVRPNIEQVRGPVSNVI